MAHGTGSSRDSDDVHQDTADPELIATLLPTLRSLIQEGVQSALASTPVSTSSSTGVCVTMPLSVIARTHTHTHVHIIGDTAPGVPHASITALVVVLVVSLCCVA